VILVELDSDTIWWVKEETLPTLIFKRKKKKQEAFLLYQPSHEQKVTLKCTRVYFNSNTKQYFQLQCTAATASHEKHSTTLPSNLQNDSGRRKLSSQTVPSPFIRISHEWSK
jgi:hypothetical protein